MNIVKMPNGYRAYKQSSYFEVVGGDPTDTVFGSEVHGRFNVTRIEQDIEKVPSLFPKLEDRITKDLVEYIIANIDIDRAHIMNYPRDKLWTPGIAIHLGDLEEGKPEVYMIDGHNRILARLKEGLKTFAVYIVPRMLVECYRVRLYAGDQVNGERMELHEKDVREADFGIYKDAKGGYRVDPERRAFLQSQWGRTKP